MKKIILILTLLLTACNESGGKSGSTGSSPDSSTPTVTQPSAPTAPTTDPGATPAPQPTPAPAPAPQPQADLSCYYNAGAFCTGGNLGSQTVQLDLTAMFTAGNPQEQITHVTITNDIVATSSQTCAQPNGPGCYANSVCVEVTMVIQGFQQLFYATKCGDAVNSSNQFEDL